MINVLTGIIAVANVISAFMAVATLFVLINVRGDWLKPKSNDVILDLKLTIKAWLEVRNEINQTVYGGSHQGRPSIDEEEAISKYLHSVEYFIADESSHWSNLILLMEKYMFYYPSVDSELIKSIKDIRMDMSVETTAFLTEVKRIKSIEDIEMIKRDDSNINGYEITINQFMDKLVVSR